MVAACGSGEPSDSTVSEQDAVATSNTTTTPPKEVVVVGHV